MLDLKEAEEKFSEIRELRLLQFHYNTCKNSMYNEKMAIIAESDLNFNDNEKKEDK